MRLKSDIFICSLWKKFSRFVQFSFQCIGHFVILLLFFFLHFRYYQKLSARSPCEIMVNAGLCREHTKYVWRSLWMANSCFNVEPLVDQIKKEKRLAKPKIRKRLKNFGKQRREQTCQRVEKNTVSLSDMRCGWSKWKMHRLL